MTCNIVMNKLEKSNNISNQYFARLFIWCL